MITKISKPIILLLFIIISVIFYTSLDNNVAKLRESQSNVDILESSVSDQEQEITQLQSKLESSQNQITQEKVLRDELLLQKEGELIFKLPAIVDVSISPSPSPTPVTPWEEWQEVLFN